MKRLVNRQVQNFAWVLLEQQPLKNTGQTYLYQAVSCDSGNQIIVEKVEQRNHRSDLALGKGNTVGNIFFFGEEPKEKCSRKKQYDGQSSIQTKIVQKYLVCSSLKFVLKF